MKLTEKVILGMLLIGAATGIGALYSHFHKLANGNSNLYLDRTVTQLDKNKDKGNLTENSQSSSKESKKGKNDDSGYIYGYLSASGVF